MSVRPAAVAALFYPGDAQELSSAVDTFLAAAASQASAIGAWPRAVIVPHAGYIYSGQTAAYAYQAIRGASFSRVALFGPAHRVGFYGMAVPEADKFETPLGAIPINREGLREALNHPDVQSSDLAQAQEHSLEVQLPFLQSVLGHFELLPVCVGMVDPEAVAEVMSLFLEDPDTLVVISSDLSHFHDYESARAIDHATVNSILSMHGPIGHEQACGATGINALLLLAEKQGLVPRLLDYRNSGDTAGDKLRVVGYASIAWFDQECLNE
ncbi:hypothetical protein Ga0123462_0375 [Mariprofundus ferrinatatus]|uniref:MEMO1 family protein Ga0123462_0375 n=1 Tax=Mariprofundus ferrinatatus TaxID=1921087 RepID=A0A2K8L1P8_9PROT|nr:AmmeMemoRadiSam system protein B [Mariprofundus ferrinatatus]ATX81250.1 hypothetical protein Ga0123462_0375 [Mariprofundus ferrinatatus]